MTAVARATIGNVPFMFGDLLISGDEVEGRALNLPTIDTNIGSVFPEGSGFVPTGLRQKLAIIDKDLVIGWSGPAYLARTVINELRAKSLEQKIGIYELRKFLTSIDKDIWQKGLSLAGYLWDGDTNYPFDVRGQLMKRDDAGDIVFLGGAPEIFCTYFSETNDVPGLRAGKDGSGLASEDQLKVLGRALSIAGRLFTDEIFQTINLLHYFGGGFEIVSRFGDEYKKVGDITFHFHNAWTDGDRVTLGQPKKVINLTYVEDVLLLRSETWQTQDESGRTETTTKLCAVDPVYRNSRPQEWRDSRPSLKSLIHCLIFTFHDRNRIPSLLTSVIVGDSTDKLLIEEEDSTLKRFGWNKTYLDQIAVQLRANY